MKEVLKRFAENGLRVNVSKCDFFADSIEYCGYGIDSDGIHKTKEKISAIQQMPRPQNRDTMGGFFVTLAAKFILLITY